MAGTSLASQKRNQGALGRSAKALAEVLGAIGVGGKDGLADVGVEVTNRVKRLLSQPGTGRVYRRRRVTHRASRPGQPPAVDTGRLRSSYTWRTGEDAEGFFVEVGTNVKYAPFLEFGTRRMRPRPHLRPAINEVTNQISELVAQGVIAKQTEVIRRLPAEIVVE